MASVVCQSRHQKTKNPREDNMFETLVIIALLGAMLGCKHPKQFAIVIVLMTAILLRPIEVYGLYWAESFVSFLPFISLPENTYWIAKDLMVFFQCLSAIFIVLFSISLKGSDKMFFLIMAGFMFCNSAWIPAYKYNFIVEEETYVLMYHLTTITQVLTVFYYSNGTRNLIRGAIDFFSVFGRRAITSRG